MTSSDIVARQDASGGWSPAEEVSAVVHAAPLVLTTMALWSLIAARSEPLLRERIGHPRYDVQITKGIHWLFNVYDAARAWVPNPNRAHQREEFAGLTARDPLRLVAGRDAFKLNDQTQYRTAAKGQFLDSTSFSNRSFVDNNDRTPDSDVSSIVHGESNPQLEPSINSCGSRGRQRLTRVWHSMKA